MDHVAIDVRTPDSGTGLLDQSADELFTTSNRTGDSACGPGRTQSILSEPKASSEQPQAANPTEETLAENVIRQQIWFQLPVSERQRFGHCFSVIVLKALGLSSEKAKEANS